jgi:hypothetical protein
VKGLPFGKQAGSPGVTGSGGCRGPLRVHLEERLAMSLPGSMASLRRVSTNRHLPSSQSIV